MKLIRVNMKFKCSSSLINWKLKNILLPMKSESHFRCKKFSYFDSSLNLLANFCLSLFKWSPMVSDMVSPEIPFVFNFLLANLTLKLLSNCVHV
jgi:hypothetical protein